MNHSNPPLSSACAASKAGGRALELLGKRAGRDANSRLRNTGFTLLEVMVASAVLILGIVSAITTLQRGFQSLDSARNLTAASQLMQSEMERMRLKNWSQIEAMQTAGRTELTTEDARFVCTLAITDLKTDMKEIVLQANWQGYDGRPQTARLITRYGKSGLNDYFYTSH
jgi:Tfp pilus assembly protein PilV